MRALTAFSLCVLVHQTEKPNGTGTIEQGTPELTATFIGKAFFVGNEKDYTPMPIPLPDPHPCYAFCAERHRREPIVYEDVMLNVHTDPVTIRNVIVSLKTPAGGAKAPESPIVVEMKGCVFRPHVVAVQAGQTLRFVNADDGGMVVHLLPTVNPEASYSRPRRGEQQDFQLQAEPPFRVRSDIHPWTSLWVAVFDHPYFAVTGEDGSFKLSDVPPGKHTLEAWHEKFGTLRSEVELKPRETKTVNFTFEPKPEKP